MGAGQVVSTDARAERHRTRHGNAVDHERHVFRPVATALAKVPVPVEWIDDPHPGCAEACVVARLLLGEHSVVGAKGGELAENGLV